MLDANTLIAYSTACGFFARIFRPEVDRDLLRRCARDRLAETWPVDADGPDACKGLILLGQAFDALDNGTLGSIDRDNTKLFIGPADPVPMWESVWTTEERLLFADCAYDVAQAFAQAGLEVPVAGGEPPDHLAHEFSFLAALLARAGQAVEAGNALQADQHVDVAATFFGKHPGRWAIECLREIDRRATTDLYRGAALLAADLIAGLGPWLDANAFRNPSVRSGTALPCAACARSAS